MPKRLRDSWQTLPPLYKKRLWQGLGAYAAVMLALGGWAWSQHASAKTAWNEQIPQIESEIRHVYLSPQLTDLSNPDFSLADIHSATEPGAILLVMTDLGLSKQTDERAIHDMPEQVVLAFSPYGKNAGTRAAAAQKDGHDIAALIPMEPTTYPKDDPGPLALLANNSARDNERLLGRVFAAVPKAAAGINYMGSRFLTDAENTDLVMKAMESRKMAFIETPAAYGSSIKKVATARDVPAFSVDVFVDDRATEPQIRAQLAELERLSRQKGVAVGMMRPLPLTFALLTNWIPTLESRNIRLVNLADAQKAQNAPARSAAPAALTPVNADEAVAPAPPSPPASTQEAPINGAE